MLSEMIDQLCLTECADHQLRFVWTALESLSLMPVGGKEAAAQNDS